jgi:hypothetical protein
MKTNVTMISQDRNLFGVIIEHETKTNLMCLSTLEKAYNSVAVEKGWSEKRFADLVRRDSFVERAFYLLKEGGVEHELLKSHFYDFNNYIRSQGISKFLKEIGWWKIRGKGVGRTTWCNPYIWVSVALEFNPEIYAKVIHWLTDSLIFNRIECGSKYLPMTSAIKKYIEPNYPITNNFNIYSKFAIEINYVVFNRHYNGIRQNATKQELNKLLEIEQKVETLIKFGIIKSLEDLQEKINNI